MRVYSSKSLKNDRGFPKVNSIRVFAPGRLNLIGEHTDYNGGKVLPFCIDRGLEIEAEAFKDDTRSIRIFSSTFDQILECSWDDVIEKRTIDPVWTRYALGCLYQCSEMVPQDMGLDVVVGNGLDTGAGMSSSAAFCTGFLSAVAELCGASWDTNEIALRAQKVEHEFVGTQCGLMDQLAILNGKPDSLLLIDFDDSKTSAAKIKSVNMHPAFEDFQCLVVNTNVKHNLADSEYNQRRQACNEALKILSQFFGEEFSSLGVLAHKEQFSRLFKLPQAMESQDKLLEFLKTEVFASHSSGELLARRATHAIMENLRVDAALRALSQGDASRLSEAMHASHMSLSELYEVSCPELDALREEILQMAASLVKAEELSSVLIGPRLCGGGFGGSVIMLVHSNYAGRLMNRLKSSETKYQRQFGIVPTPSLVRISTGLHRIEQSQAEGWQ